MLTISAILESCQRCGLFYCDCTIHLTLYPLFTFHSCLSTVGECVQVSVYTVHKAKQHALLQLCKLHVKQIVLSRLLDDALTVADVFRPMLSRSIRQVQHIRSTSQRPMSGKNPKQEVSFSYLVPEPDDRRKLLAVITLRVQVQNVSTTICKTRPTSVFPFWMV